MFSDDLNHTYLVTLGPAGLYLRISNVAALKAQGLPDGWGFGAQATVQGTRCAAYACWGLTCGAVECCCSKRMGLRRRLLRAAAACPQPPPALRPLWVLRRCRPSFRIRSSLPPH